MNTIGTPEEAIAFLERFYQFFDSLVWKIQLELTSSRRSRNVNIILGARDGSQVTSREWINVQIFLGEVSEYCVKEEEQSQIQVLSNGVKVSPFGETLLIDFDPYTDAPQSVEDIRRSHLYFACKSIKWKILEYDENQK